MSHVALAKVIRYVQSVSRTLPCDDLSDGALLARYVSRRDETAFALLVQRHGPRVFGVCHRVLRQRQDAEDAFQATFCVLARKAGSIIKRESLGSWLHAIAFRTAQQARHSRRHPTGPQPDQLSAALIPSPLEEQELRAVLDEELDRLPRKYRTALLTHYLEGRSLQEAAAQLGWTIGQLRGVLFRARQLLHDRLGERGFALSSGILTLAAAETALPPALAEAAVRTALQFTMGKSLSAQVASPAIALAKGVLDAMFVTKIKIAAVVLLGVTMLGFGAGQFGGPSPAANAANQVQPLAVTRQTADADEKADPELEKLRRQREAVERQRLQQLKADAEQALRVLQEEMQLLQCQLREKETDSQMLQERLKQLREAAPPNGINPAEPPDGQDTWTLDFRCRDLQFITVDVPGQGRRSYCYLWYQVSNPTNLPRTFIPAFELVTLEQPRAHGDQVLPGVLEAIRQREDPKGELDIKNSVTMAALPLPAAGKDAAPRAVTGVALWPEVSPDAPRCVVLVAGLSNGFRRLDNQLIRRKTLQLNFHREGQELRLVPAANWWYRAAALSEAPGAPIDPARAKPEPAFEPSSDVPRLAVPHNPPPDDVRGRVIAVDSQNGLVTINRGSDHGLSKGHTLEVYRLKPRPQYVGTLRVHDVRPFECIGKLTSPGQVQKDDEAASTIHGAPTK